MAETLRIAGCSRTTLRLCRALGPDVEEPLVVPFSGRSIIQLSLGWWRPKKRFLMAGVRFHPEALIIALQTTQRAFGSSLIRPKLQKLAAGTAQWICVTRAITFTKSSTTLRARKRDEMREPHSLGVSRTWLGRLRLLPDEKAGQEWGLRFGWRGIPAKLGRIAPRNREVIFNHHRSPPGRANARPMTGSGGDPGRGLKGELVVHRRRPERSPAVTKSEYRASCAQRAP